MSHKLIARILEVVTSPATGETYVTTVTGTLETIPLNRRWNHRVIHEKVTDEIQKRIKNGILKQNVGYVVYTSTGHGLQLQYANVQPEFTHLPCRWL